MDAFEERRDTIMDKMYKYLEECFERYFFTNDEADFEFFKKVYAEYQLERGAYVGYLYDYDQAWQACDAHYDNEIYLRYARRDYGHDLTLRLDEQKERARWFSSPQFFSTEDYEASGYECERKIFCGQYWCQSHYNEYIYHHHGPVYQESDWEEMGVDEEVDDPEHEHHLYMFHSQDPAFHDAYLACSPDGCGVVEDHNESEMEEAESSWVYNRKPVISDDSDTDSDATYIEEDTLCA